MLFTQTKKQAHRMHILLGLLGLQVGELHGNLSQTQRLEALRYGSYLRSSLLGLIRGFSAFDEGRHRIHKVMVEP